MYVVFVKWVLLIVFSVFPPCCTLTEHLLQTVTSVENRKVPRCWCFHSAVWEFDYMYMSVSVSSKLLDVIIGFNSDMKQIIIIVFPFFDIANNMSRTSNNYLHRRALVLALSCLQGLHLTPGNPATFEKRFCERYHSLRSYVCKCNAWVWWTFLI